MNYYLAIDPSGNFHEGKGVTGWVVINDDLKIIKQGTIEAKDYGSTEEYWNAHTFLFCLPIVYTAIIEDFRLYQHKASNQINSKMETCRLLGLLQWYCWTLNVPHYLQLASEVKNRWTDAILQTELKDPLPENKHIRDALRHAVHYVVCKETHKETKANQTKGAFNNVRSNY